MSNVNNFNNQVPVYIFIERFGRSQNEIVANKIDGMISISADMLLSFYIEAMSEAEGLLLNELFEDPGLHIRKSSCYAVACELLGYLVEDDDIYYSNGRGGIYGDSSHSLRAIVEWIQHYE